MGVGKDGVLEMYRRGRGVAEMFLVVVVGVVVGL